MTSATDFNADALVIWNRYGANARLAEAFEQRGKPVLVAENGYLGREWQGGQWYALARNHHNGLGSTPFIPARGEAWLDQLQPWRESGSEIVVLAQRGIGEPGVAQPSGWAQHAAAELQRRTKSPVRVREHPGERGAAIPLEKDLANAWACVTWGSGAGLRALMQGVPVFHGLKGWIGGVAARMAGHDVEDPYRGNCREALLQRLGGAMWNVEEIASGEPFRHLLPAAREAEGAAHLRGVCARV